MALWLKLIILSLIWIGIGALFAFQITIFDKVPRDMAFHFALMDWGPWIIISPLVIWFGARVQISATTWKWALPAHVLSSILVAIVLENVVRFSFRHMWFDRPALRDREARLELQAPPGRPALAERQDSFGGPVPSNRLGPPPPRDRGPGREGGPGMELIRARFNVPIYWLLVVSMHAVAYHRRSLERERRALQAEALLAEAQWAALQAQINPHFLFNTLNAVALYVHEDPKTAEAMIESLSEMLRTVLAAANRREVSLLEELAFVDRYLAIQQIRFADRLTVKHEIDSNALNAKVPTLFLQPLVENAVIHGIAPERLPGVIFIRAHCSERRLSIQIVDTGNAKHSDLPAGTPLNAKEGLGLSNTRARLQAIFGRDFNFTLATAQEGGVCAQIDIPLIPILDQGSSLDEARVRPPKG
jgi:Histidine kinase